MENYLEFIVSREDLVGRIYKAMLKDDMSEVVITAQDILVRMYLMQTLMEDKSEAKSNEFRRAGNMAYELNEYQNALELYNKALRCAPDGSLAMKLAFSNRSALLYKCGAFTACLKDIQTCFSMGCPPDIIEKLRDRKSQCVNNVWRERLIGSSDTFMKQFFSINETYKPIPCASNKIRVTNDNKFPKVVASTDIKVGEVIALETAFVSHTSENQNSCYYCLKMSLNLIPCNKCCYALFCDETCKEKCIQDYHDIECQIIQVYQFMPSTFNPNKAILAFRAALKIRKMCKSWTEFISSSDSIGCARADDDAVNKIYDVNNKQSLLNCEENNHFIHGTIFNVSFFFARVIHYLEIIPNYLPHDSKMRQAAVRALAKIMMYLCIYPSCIELISARTKQHQIECSTKASYGYFSFVGKLKKECYGNTIPVSLNNKIALIAIQPIKVDTEITMSFWFTPLNFLDKDPSVYRAMLTLTGTICEPSCMICRTDDILLKSYELTETQKTVLHKLNLESIKSLFENGQNFNQTTYMKLCRALAFLSNLPHSKEWIDVFRIFRMCIMKFQDVNSSNIALS